jgi:hypothetical protein
MTVKYHEATWSEYDDFCWGHSRFLSPENRKRLKVRNGERYLFRPAEDLQEDEAHPLKGAALISWTESRPSDSALHRFTLLHLVQGFHRDGLTLHGAVLVRHPDARSRSKVTHALALRLLEAPLWAPFRLASLPSLHTATDEADLLGRTFQTILLEAGVPVRPPPRNPGRVAFPVTVSHLGDCPPLPAFQPPFWRVNS